MTDTLSQSRDRSPARRHAVITGGGSGIGAAIANQLMLSGACVTVMGRRLEKLESVIAGMDQARAVAMDVSDEKSVETAMSSAVDGFGAVDILINNAGFVSPEKLERMSPAAFRQALDVNLMGPFLCSRQVLPGMISNGSGQIINIASTAALKGYAYVSAYTAAKHGVLGLTRALALEVAANGVTVNAVCPGYTNTEIVETALQNIQEKTGRSRTEALCELTKTNPQGRLIEPWEVAKTVLWLCQPGARSITGQAITIAGGEVM